MYQGQVLSARAQRIAHLVNYSLKALPVIRHRQDICRQHQLAAASTNKSLRVIGLAVLVMCLYAHDGAARIGQVCLPLRLRR